MANLLDTIRQNSQGLPRQGVTDETQKLQTLLRAKSGKAVGGGPVAASNLAEQSAVNQTNLQLQNQVAPVAALQTKQLEQQQADITQSEKLQQAEIDQSRRFDNLQTRLKIDQTLNQLEQGKGELDMRRKGAAVEQVAQSLRLQNKQYINELQQRGQLARLENEAEFRKAALAAAMGNRMELMNNQNITRSILADNDREFKRRLAQVSISDAWAIFNADRAAAKNEAMWSGAGSLAKAGLGAYGTYASSNPSSGNSVDTTVAGAQSSNVASRQQSTTSGDAFIDFLGKNK